MQTTRQSTVKITPAVKKELIQIIDQRIKDVHVTKEDFSELKSIVREIVEIQKRTDTKIGELAEAQKRTESRVEELAEAQKDLAEAQKRTESRVEELAEAQKRTEISIAKLAKGLDQTRTELGGLARSVSYSLENEAFRQLPQYLKDNYGIELKDRMIRLDLEGEEINIFARGTKNGRDVLIVGEAELRLSSVGKLRQLERKVSAACKQITGECIPLIVTHFARQPVLDKAKEKGIIIVQSFEW